MKLAVAQTTPVKGDIPANIQQHLALVDIACADGVSLIVFPELSLTGYEPELARSLATTADDARLNPFQDRCDRYNIIIGVGLPLVEDKGIQIGMVLLTPHAQRRVYAKHFLHEDESPYFVAGENLPIIEVENTRIAVAICYELSVATHRERARNNAADVYLASVAKTLAGMASVTDQLKQLYTDFNMTVMIGNSVGQQDNFMAPGGSSCWCSAGGHNAQLDDELGLVVFDTTTGSAYATRL